LNAHDRDSQLLISRDSETRHIIPAPDALRGGSIILAVRFEFGCRRRRNFLPITRTSTENHVMSTIRTKDHTQMIGEVSPDAENRHQLWRSLPRGIRRPSGECPHGPLVVLKGSDLPFQRCPPPTGRSEICKARATHSGSIACNPVSRTSSIAEGFSETDFSADLCEVDMPTVIYPATTTRSCRSGRRLMLRRSSSATWS